MKKLILKRKYLLEICLVILTLLFLGKNVNFVNAFYDELYHGTIDFSFFKDICNKYLGGVTVLKNRDSEIPVFNFENNYNRIVAYKNGVKLYGDNNFLVHSLSSGVVIKKDESLNYGNRVVVNGDDGINYLYENICNVKFMLYDNIDAGDIIAESCTDYFYLVLYNKEGYIDYNSLNN